jgi:glutamate-1-semialdehyde 2,1-aminomutase
VPPGVPRAIAALHRGCGWNDVDGVRKVFEESGKQIAALVVAADYARMEEGRAFYPFLREITTRHGALLIHDEIVTGFRVALGGVQEYFGVTPDLAVFAKGIANGMPLSVYCGKANVMDRLSEAIVSSTYGGETLSLAAAKATITTYRNENVIAHLWRMGERLTTGLNNVFRKRGLPIELEGPAPCVAFSYGRGAAPDLPARLFRAAYRHGVSMYDVLYVNFSHAEADIDETVGRMEWAAAEL